jgi:hypothetical protein
MYQRLGDAIVLGLFARIYALAVFCLKRRPA